MVENRQKLYNILCYPVKKDFCSDIHHLKSIVCLSVHYHIATYHTTVSYTHLTLPTKA